VGRRDRREKGEDLIEVPFQIETLRNHGTKVLGLVLKMWEGLLYEGYWQGNIG